MCGVTYNLNLHMTEGSLEFESTMPGRIAIPTHVFKICATAAEGRGFQQNTHLARARCQNIGNGILGANVIKGLKET